MTTDQDTDLQLSDRQSAIKQLVEKTGFATVAELASLYSVTTQTIRRDVNALCDAGHLARFHGGVGLPSSIENEDYTDRRASFSDAKEKIGALVAEIVPNRASLFLNIGTTTEAVAAALQDHRQLSVVTNSLHVAGTLSDQDGFEVMVAGGRVRTGDGGIVGEAAIEFLQGFRLDFGIIGISGIDRDGALLDFDYREVRAAQAIIENARQVILVADHNKFGRAAMAKVGGLDLVDILVTDCPPPDEFLPALREAGVRVVHP
ncbi:DeoR family transcriptional regulator [Parvularcula sp. ZS-1/3]|uniref:DeoR family transcriptional regulator n=1 Tax=Parvularcula mediterranea TaxID=2732508 RepID=A0A7Y3RLC5_9PROT|nr:DeoR family transcriptional regulator [Parvularcula mediterranea]NNU16216.1 DeoR family transcriptional regulator [Parvularcula mediterranea]